MKFPQNFFQAFLLSATGAFYLLVFTRQLLWRRRGIRVETFSKGKPRGEKVRDFLVNTVVTARLYEIIAYVCALKFHLFPQSLGFGRVLVDSPAWHIAGVIFLSAALAVYAVANVTMGKSWRIGIESKPTCPLITHGIFKWSRNPIYLAFAGLAIGTFFILGRMIFLVLALASLALIHWQIWREEKFLAAAHGEAYGKYCAQTGRYFKWF